MNRVILCGRLTRDVEVRYSQDNSTAIARMSIAVDRRVKKDGEANADFINCVAFGKTAEFLERFGFKGTKFIIEGRWQTGSYTNRDGQKVYTNDCLVESVEFAESKNQNQDSKPAKTNEDGWMNIPDGLDDEGLPF